MSKSIQDALDLPTLENLLRSSAPTADDNAEPEIDDEGEVAGQDALSTQMGNALASPVMTPEMFDEQQAKDHATSMDTIFDETLQHSRDLMDLGYNVDTRSAGRIFENAATMYKLALDAKNSKRKAQLDLIKAQQEQQKIDLVAKNKNGEGGGAMEAESVIVEDRNELLRQLRDQSNK